MSLDEVHLVSDVLHTCTVHALTTSSEEVMGILLGDVIKDENGKSVGRIWRALPQIRTDRRKDRVEPSHHQLSDCISKADELSEKTGCLTRVIGWYHSHPNITVQPSHVDLRTQAQHQSLDSGFVGLIISCFNQDQVIKCTAFQTITQQESSEDNLSHRMNSYGDDEELKRAIRDSLNEYNARNQHSNDNVELKHKEIPLKVIRPHEPCEYSLMDCANLHNILYKEELQAYDKATQSQNHVSNLVRLHQSSIYQQILIKLMNGVFIPDLNALIALDQQTEMNIRQLDEQIEHYTALLAKKRTPDPATLSQFIADNVSFSPTELDAMCDPERGGSLGPSSGGYYNTNFDPKTRRDEFTEMGGTLPSQHHWAETFTIPENPNDKRVQKVPGPPSSSGMYFQRRRDSSTIGGDQQLGGNLGDPSSQFMSQSVIDYTGGRREDQPRPPYSLTEPNKHIGMRIPSQTGSSSSHEHQLITSRLQQQLQGSGSLLPPEHQRKASNQDIVPPGPQCVPFVSFNPPQEQPDHGLAAQYLQRPTAQQHLDPDRRSSSVGSEQTQNTTPGTIVGQSPAATATSFYPLHQRSQSIGQTSQNARRPERLLSQQETNPAAHRIRTNQNGEITNISVPRIPENDDYAQQTRAAYRPQRKS